MIYTVNVLAATTSNTDYEKLAATLDVVTIVLYVLAGICLLAAVFLFFRFKIINIVGDLSGRNARKSIRQKREENERKGREQRQSAPYTVPKREEAQRINTGSEKTEKLSPSMGTDALQYDANGTEVLKNGTEVLNGNIASKMQSPNKFIIIQDIVLVHSEEVI